MTGCQQLWKNCTNWISGEEINSIEQWWRRWRHETLSMHQRVPTGTSSGPFIHRRKRVAYEEIWIIWNSNAFYRHLTGDKKCEWPHEWPFDIDIMCPTISIHSSTQWCISCVLAFVQSLCTHIVRRLFTSSPLMQLHSRPPFAMRWILRMRFCAFAIDCIAHNIVMDSAASVAR